jgi:hypothetical protein
MSAIRPLAPGDVEQMVGLFDLAMQAAAMAGSRPGLGPYLRRVFLENAPGLGPGMCPLVYEAQGRIQGFIGVHVRRFRFEGEPASVVATGPLFTAPEARLAGAFLLKAVLDGPQLLTITDGATPAARRLWERAGGRVSALGAVRWTRVFRPFRLLSAHLGRRRRIGPLWRPLDLLGSPLWNVADAVVRTVARSCPRPSEMDAEDLDAARLVQGLEALAPHYRLCPDYDVASAAWLLREMRFVTERGPLRGQLLRDAKGRIAGSYLYYAPRGRIGHVLQVAARPREHEPVLAHLFADADVQGVCALQGRMEPQLVPALREMGVRLHYDASFTLVHSRDERVYAALFGGDALLSRLDGEWFFGFQLARP